LIRQLDLPTYIADRMGGARRRRAIWARWTGFSRHGLPPFSEELQYARTIFALPALSDANRLFDRDVAVPETTLTGLTGLSERSVRCSGDIGSPPPPRRLYDHEVFHRPAVRSVRRPTGSSHRLRLPHRVQAEMPSLTMPGQIAPPGVQFPFSDIGGGICMTRVCLTRHVPSSGFLAPSTG
jgi:hypothetical protein